MKTKGAKRISEHVRYGIVNIINLFWMLIFWALDRYFLDEIIAVGLNKLARIYEKVTSFERKARLLTGIIFIGVGIYYTLTIIFVVNFYQ